MKNVMIFIMLLIIAAMAWWIINHPPKPVSPVEIKAKETVKAEVERITRKVDSMGFEHAAFDETKQTLSKAGLVADSSLLRKVDSLTSLVGIERHNFRSYVKTQSRIVDSLMKAVKTDDGYSYSDKWVSLALKTPTATDSAMFSFSYNAEVNMLQYWKRSWFLGSKKPYMDLWMSDPRAKINGVQRLIVEPEPDQFSLSIQAIGDYHPRAGAGLGAGARIQVGRLGLQGAYLYDGQQWYPAFRGSYDLIAW